jgi:hypothetical protein
MHARMCYVSVCVSKSCDRETTACGKVAQGTEGREATYVFLSQGLGVQGQREVHNVRLHKQTVVGCKDMAEQALAVRGLDHAKLPMQGSGGRGRGET